VGKEGGEAVLAVGLGAVLFDFADEAVETPPVTTLGVTAATFTGLVPLDFVELPCPKAKPVPIAEMSTRRVT
jgi:hypothetical protein